MKIRNKRKLQQIALNNLSDIEFQKFMTFYVRFQTKKPFSFSVNDATLPSDNLFRCTKQTIIK